LYGPLCNGSTSVLFESTPIYPDPGRYWETIDRLKINQLYTSPTAIRLLFKHGNKWVNKYSLSSLKMLGSVGEPLNHSAYEWFNTVVGKNKCHIADTWWQTETGSISITPLPMNTNDRIKPSMVMTPFFGIDSVLLDKNGNELPPKNSKGILCIKSPWPSMARTIYGEHQRYIDTYFKDFPGYFFTGDGCISDSDGHLRISGRVDDVINVSGHRIGTAEIEDALNEHETVSESAVIGYPHELYGEGIYAFVIPKTDANTSNEDKLAEELRSLVKNKISSFAIPHRITITSALPKTRSGKIMRRILRKIGANRFDELGDTSTLADPQAVETIINKHKEHERRGF
jgi:acetyl-CoA synthetase